MKMDNELKVYSLEEIAEIIGVTKRTMYTYVKDGKLKAVKIGKNWRVSYENLKEFLDKGTNKK